MPKASTLSRRPPDAASSSVSARPLSHRYPRRIVTPRAWAMCRRREGLHLPRARAAPARPCAVLLQEVLSLARACSLPLPHTLSRVRAHAHSHSLTHSVCVQLRSGECRPELADVHPTHDAQGRCAWRRQRRGIGAVYAGGSVPAVLKPATGCWLHVPRQSEPAGEADVLL